MIADKKDPLLRIEDLTVHYGAAQALFGIDLAVAPGETVALVGANGAGKTSLLKAVMGLAPPSGGRIFLDGVDVTGSTPAAMAALGVALCPEGREMFGGLTVKENLELGALALRISKPEMGRRLAAVYDRFPQLKARTGQRTNTLSGGEQQMVAMGRALMAQPRLLLLDEPSLGLAPLITDEIFDIIKQLTRAGVTTLLVEQNAARALTASSEPIFWPTAASSARATATNSWWTRNCAGPSWGRAPTTTRPRPAWARRDLPISDWRSRI